MRCASIAIGVLAFVLSACDGEGPSVLPNEPIQVVGGQFISGPLPGTPPPDGGGNPAGSLAVTQISAPELPLGAGAVDQSVSGEVTNEAVSVGLAMAGLGTGYWVVPVGSTDPLTGEYAFSFSVNFNPSDPSGVHMLQAVAIDAAGKAGQTDDARVCLSNPIPDNGHACNPAKDPPAAVISLHWDVGFNLVLHVVLPDGTDLNPKSSVGALVDGGTSTLAFDRDSWGGCIPDGFYQEDLVFQTSPAPGTYGILVDPFAACGQPAVHFTIAVYVRQGTCPACELVPVFNQAGELLASQVTGGASAGLFVHDQTF